MNENELYFSYFTMINLIFLFIHVYFCFNFITYANRYIIAKVKEEKKTKKEVSSPTPLLLERRNKKRMIRAEQQRACARDFLLKLLINASIGSCAWQRRVMRMILLSHAHD